VCECVKDADAQGKEAGVQSLQHTIRNPDRWRVWSSRRLRGPSDLFGPMVHAQVPVALYHPAAAKQRFMMTVIAEDFSSDYPSLPLNL